jgi:hypothetical protein
MAAIEESNDRKERHMLTQHGNCLAFFAARFPEKLLFISELIILVW